MSDEPLYRHRQARARKARFRFFLMVTLFLLCVAGIAGAVWFSIDHIERSKQGKGGDDPGHAATPNPKAGFPPDDWTNRDLANYLKQKGVRLEMDHAPLFDKPDRPASFFRNERGVAVLVYLCRDEKSAREAAGAMPEGAFSLGRFAVGYIEKTDKRSQENAQFLSQIHTALR